jgi:acyl dehydratase
MTDLADPRALRQSLIGTRLPEGSFTIDPEAHRTFTDAVFAEGWESDVAHPMFLHLVAHCGKGMPLEEFFELLGTRLESGVTFGQGRLQFLAPLRVGATYRVVTDIAAVEHKEGRRRGPFDVVTCHIDVFDADGTHVGVSDESYVVPSTEE